SFFFQAEDGIRDFHVTGVQTCALPICRLTWLGTYNLGLPVADAIRDRIKPDPKAERMAKKMKAELEALRRPARQGAARGKKRRRSEERRVGKKRRSRSCPEQRRKNKTR